MATTNSELIDEVRALTGYDEHIFSDLEMLSLLNICKEEIRADLDDPDFTFFVTGDNDTHQADRALFWFLSVATKIRAGEIGGIDISVADLDAEQVNDDQASIWISNFHNRLNSVGEGGRQPSHVRVNRGTERDYGSER